MEEGRSWEDLGHPRQVPVVLNRPVNDHDEALLRAVTEGLDHLNPDGRMVSPGVAAKRQLITGMNESIQIGTTTYPLLFDFREAMVRKQSRCYGAFRTFALQSWVVVWSVWLLNLWFGQKSLQNGDGSVYPGTLM